MSDAGHPNEASTQDWHALRDLIAHVNKEIARALKTDGGKSYEGTWELRTPAIVDARHDSEWVLKLHCYLLGPARHYEWKAPTLGQVVRMAWEAVEAWALEDAEEDAHDPRH